MTTILTDNQHYANIASAIRSKAGVQDLFKPSQMASAINAIPTGGGASLGSKTINTNGTYYASADSLDGYSQVTVNVSGGGGGGGGNEDGIIERTITSLYNSTASKVARYFFYLNSLITSVQMDNVSTIGSFAFNTCQNLTSAIFPSCTYIDMSAFCSCPNLETISFPSCTQIGGGAFMSCSGSLKLASFPLCTNIDNGAFKSCHKLESAFFPECSNLGNEAFANCSKLSDVRIPKCENIFNSAFYYCTSMTELVLPECKYIAASAFIYCSMFISLNFTGVSSVPRLSRSNVFAQTPIGGVSTYAGQYGSIYVPSSLYDAFISASNWSYFNDRIVSV